MDQVQSLYKQDLPKDSPPTTRPEFYKGVRVRMPEDYDFSHKGTFLSMKMSTGKATKKTTDLGLMQCGKNNS